MFLHGCEYLRAEITALLLVALLLAILPLSRLGLVGLLGFLLTFLFAIGTLLVFFRGLEYLKSI